MMDRESFRVVFLTHYDRLCRYAVGLGHARQDAEDLVQAVFVRLWEEPGGLQQTNTVSAYLYGAVRHASLNSHRARRTRARIHAGDGDDGFASGLSSTASPRPDEVTERRELTHAVQAAIAALPERGREAFLLHRESELSYKEIASVMKVSEATVKTHIARALMSLRASLRPWRDGCAPTPPNAGSALSADSGAGGP
jgi:RNA polymerase sigma-70 factor (ECF subfamily)